jgi:hypothetical protein
VLAAQAHFDLGHKDFRKPRISEGLLEGFGGVLRLAVPREAFVRFEPTAPSDFGWRFGVSFD